LASSTELRSRSTSGIAVTSSDSPPLTPVVCLGTASCAQGVPPSGWISVAVRLEQDVELMKFASKWLWLAWFTVRAENPAAEEAPATAGGPTNQLSLEWVVSEVLSNNPSLH